MLTVRDCTMARLAAMRWMLDMGRNIPKIWDAGFQDEAIDMAEMLCLSFGTSER